MILYNGKIITMDRKETIAEAILIKDELIVKVGNNEEILSIKDTDEICIDLQGKSVIPGLNDSHMHLYGFGLSLQMVNLMNSVSIDDLSDRVLTFLGNHSLNENSWIQGRGWNQDYFINNNRFPNRQDLDKISLTHPIVLSRACGHMIVVNSKALELCGIGETTKQVEGGEFDIDLGLFREHAMSLIMDNVPNPSLHDIRNMLINALEYANSRGLTSIQTDDLSHAGDYKLMLEAYESLRNEKKLTCRIYEQCLLNSKEQFNEFLSLGYKTGVGDDFFKIGPLKILSDGSLGARTAALRNPYADSPDTNGIMCYSEEELDDLIQTAHLKDMQIAVHCIGDRAMTIVLNSYEKAFNIKNNNNHRHGIIHCQITDVAILNKFKTLNILAYVQPIFLHYDLHMVESRVGEQLAKTSYAFHTMIDKGIHTSFGTDCPVEPLDPLQNIYCAVTRSDLTGNPQGGWNPQEKLSVYDAIYHYTQEGAYASFEEKRKGSLEEGKLADFVVLNDDILLIDPVQIKDVEILMTYVGGKLVYQK